MILDQNLKLATDFSIAGAGLNGAITNVVDLSTVRGLGGGNQLAVHFRCKETPVRNAAGAYFQFFALVADDVALTTNAVVIACSPPWGSVLHAGAQLPTFDTSVLTGEKSDTTRFKMPIGKFPAPTASLYERRYFGVMYVNHLVPLAAPYDTLWFSAGKFDIDLGLDIEDLGTVYNKSFTIT